MRYGINQRKIRKVKTYISEFIRVNIGFMSREIRIDSFLPEALAEWNALYARLCRNIQCSVDVSVEQIDAVLNHTYDPSLIFR